MDTKRLTHPDGTLNLDHPDHRAQLDPDERDYLDEAGPFSTVAVCTECVPVITEGAPLADKGGGEDDTELTTWLADHPEMWTPTNTVNTPDYWTCEACRMDQIGPAHIITC